jgi:phage tail sheath protein FI
MVEQDRADSLYIIGSPNYGSVDEVVGALDGVAMDTNYSATYFPWIQIRDVDNATQLYIPPTGEVVRNIALTDNVSFPWFAVAGYSRGLVKSIKAVKKLTLDERDELYKNRINPIATFSDTGTIIWGNKTLQVRESALDRINVRRLLLRARKLISAVAVRLVFEQNDDQVRNEFLRLVNPILDAIKRERGLYDFRVTVSSDPADIDANTMRGKIYIKPTRSLEFIDVEFIITPTGASFDDV